MASGSGTKRITDEDMERVKNLIEDCMLANMNQKETVHMLFTRDRIEPVFTEMVWKRLKEENPEYFRKYHTLLLYKKLTMVVKSLFETQLVLKRKVPKGTSAPVSPPSDPKSASVHQTPFSNSSAVSSVHVLGPVSPSSVIRRGSTNDALRIKERGDDRNFLEQRVMHDDLGSSSISKDMSELPSGSSQGVHTSSDSTKPIPQDSSKSESSNQNEDGQDSNDELSVDPKTDSL